MRILFIALFSFVFIHSAYAQTPLDKKTSVTISNQPLSVLLSTLERQADIRFMYESSLIDVSKKISIKAQNKTIYYILRKAIPNEGVGFTCKGKHIIIHKKKTTSPPKKANPKNTKTMHIFKKIYDTVSVVYFDTVVTKVVDTSVILIYDTIVEKITPPQIEKKSFTSNLYYYFSLKSDFHKRSFTKTDSISLMIKNSEKLSNGFSFSFQAYKPIKLFDIGIGVEYAQLYSKLDYDNSTTATTKAIDTIYYLNSYYDYYLRKKEYKTLFGDIVEQRYLDSILVTDTVPQAITKEETQTYNYTEEYTAKYSYIGIPLSIKRPFTINPKSSVHLEIATQFDFLLLYNGPNFFEEQENKAKPLYELKKTAIHVGIGTGYEYVINPDISIILSFDCKFGKGDIYKELTSSSWQRAYSAGVGFVF